MDKEKRKVGLIVNPLAGIGGRVGLKGSDGAEIQRQALALGACPEAPSRSVAALCALKEIEEQICIITCEGSMGAEECAAAGLSPSLVLPFGSGSTTPEDTVGAALKMKEAGVELLLFAGGDGTARNVFQAVGLELAVLGIPAGVKIHSGVFAWNPRSAGTAAVQFLRTKGGTLREAEVMDLDEDAYRQGQVRPKLYGYLQVPQNEKRMQHVKARSKSETAELTSIAAQVIDDMREDVYYVIGAGTTTRRIMECLELPNTLIGVDVVRNKKLVASDVSEQQLWDILAQGEGEAVLTVIGGQGHVFGRGNQQISPRTIRRLGMKGIRIVATKQKLLSLPEHQLLTDTGDSLLDEELAGYYRITVAYGEQVICKLVSC